jgi:hypothetical protein
MKPTVKVNVSLCRNTMLRKPRRNQDTALQEVNKYCHVFGVLSLIIIRSGFDNWVNSHFFTFTINCNSSF